MNKREAQISIYMHANTHDIGRAEVAVRLAAKNREAARLHHHETRARLGALCEKQVRYIQELDKIKKTSAEELDLPKDSG